MTNEIHPQNTAAPIPLRWRIRAWLFRELFAAEYMTGQALHRVRLEQEKTMHEMSLVIQRLQRKPARFKLEGNMAPEQIEELLAGTRGLPAIKAVEALISAKIIELSDKSTDAPHGAYATPEGTVPAFGPEERLHLAGGADATALLLAELQELIKPKEQAKPEAAA